MTAKIQFEKSSGNLFEDLGFDKTEARELHLRSSLILKINQYIQKKNLTQKQASELFGVSQPRISNLMSGRVDLFSTTTLLNFLEKAGFRIYEKIEDFDQALDHYIELVQHDPSYVGTYYHLGKLYEHFDQLQKAIETYTNGIAVARQQDDELSLRELTAARLALGDVEDIP